MGEIEDRSTEDDQVVVLKPEERTKFLEYYTVVYAHLERLAAIVLYEAIGDKSNRAPETTLDFFQEDFTQSTREDLLFRIGVIDSGLKGELKKVRQKRNNITHNQASRMYIDFSAAPQSDVERARDTVDKMENILKDVSGYCPDCNKSPLVSIDSMKSLREFAEVFEIDENDLPPERMIDDSDEEVILFCSNCYSMFQQTFQKLY